ncbi:alpha/beta fold hydrolase [Streptomyces sp. NPDC086549]|uniref:alpha/beta fold hydrolase n=1 Tax=Streptomyces sp. NPDC086549 TaxID=3365752 RepID=UPI0037FB5722
MPYFESPVDGVRLHYVDHGPADGPVIVFVTSAWLGSEMWEFQMLPLTKAGYRCVSMDRRGHGRSDDVWGGFDLDTLADDLHGILDHLDLREVTFVGHSVGTAEIVRCLTRHGDDRVARVALVSGIAPGVVRTADNPDGVDPADALAANEVFRKDRAGFYEANADAFFGVGLPGVEVSPAYVRHVINRCLTTSPHASYAIQEVVVGVDLAAEMPKLALPVLVVHGTHDVSAPLEVSGARSARLVPDATLKVYENAAHGLLFTHPDRLNADLREFMA